MSFNGNIDVSADGATKNPSHGFAFQLPTPAGDGPSPWAGGLLSLGSLMQPNGWLTAHIGKSVIPPRFRPTYPSAACAPVHPLDPPTGQPVAPLRDGSVPCRWHLGGCSPPGNHTPAPSEYHQPACSPAYTWPVTITRNCGRATVPVIQLVFFDGNPHILSCVAAPPPPPRKQ